MQTKHLFLLLLAASVAAAWFLYSDDFSFSTSEAGYNQVKFAHVEGTQTLTIGETVKISWPRTYSGANVELIAFNNSDFQASENVYTLGYAPRSSFSWFVADESVAGGIPRDTLLSFRVTKDGTVIYSSSFVVKDWIGDLNN